MNFDATNSFGSWACLSGFSIRTTDPLPRPSVGTVSATPATLGGTTPIDVGNVVPYATETPVYSNITTFGGSGYAGGGAGTTSFGTTTTMVADDITTAAGSGGSVVTALEFSVASFNTPAVSAEVVLTFYDASGSQGGPGTLLGGLGIQPHLFYRGCGPGLHLRSGHGDLHLADFGDVLGR